MVYIRNLLPNNDKNKTQDAELDLLENIVIQYISFVYALKDSFSRYFANKE